MLAAKGVLGRFAVDFVSVREGDGWRHYAIEINLRKGGTTHPFLMLQFLTDGDYYPETGEFVTPRPALLLLCLGQSPVERYRGLTPYDLVDIAVMKGLHFDARHPGGRGVPPDRGVVEFGKLGILAIGNSAEKAHGLYLRPRRNPRPRKRSPRPVRMSMRRWLALRRLRQQRRPYEKAQPGEK